MRERALLFALFPAALLLAACQSPEATRSRGSGRGADGGNRTAAVDLHGKPDPFHGTPKLGSPR